MSKNYKKNGRFAADYMIVDPGNGVYEVQVDGMIRKFPMPQAQQWMANNQNWTMNGQNWQSQMCQPPVQPPVQPSVQPSDGVTAPVGYWGGYRYGGYPAQGYGSYSRD